MRAAIVLALLVPVVFTTGCDTPRSRVHGKVTVQGKPVTGGTVIFLAKDNLTYLADINPDGTYAATGIPRGPVRVSVQQPPARPPSRAEGAPPRGGPGSTAEAAADDKGKRARQTELPDTGSAAKGPAVPAVYTDPNKSGLSFELSEPDQEYLIDLK
jgi:hypothetical protein